MRSIKNTVLTLSAIVLLAAATLSLTGCAAALIAGGAVGGYALAKDLEDGQLIDSRKE